MASYEHQRQRHDEDQQSLVHHGSMVPCSGFGPEARHTTALSSPGVRLWHPRRLAHERPIPPDGLLGRMSIGARVWVETEVFDPMFCECRRHRIRWRVAPKQRGKWTRNTFVLVVRQLGSETERVPLAGQHDSPLVARDAGTFPGSAKLRSMTWQEPSESSTDPRAVLAQVVATKPGASFTSRERFEASMPDGCRIALQDRETHIWRRAAVDLYLTTEEPDGVATLPAGTIFGRRAFAAVGDDVRASTLVADSQTLAILERLLTARDRLRITNSDILVRTTLRSTGVAIRQCEALAELAELLESKYPLPPPSAIQLPPALEDLADLVTRFAIGDDGLRASRIADAGDQELRGLIEAVVQRRDQIEAAEAEESDLMWLIEAAVDARAELNERAQRSGV